MIRRPPRSTRTTHSFPTRRSSDLINDAHEIMDECVALIFSFRVVFVAQLLETNVDPSAFRQCFLEIGRAHVRTPVTNAHLVCRLLLEKTKKINTYEYSEIIHSIISHIEL